MIAGDDNDPKTATLKLVKQRLQVIDKHTDDYKNEGFAAHTPEGAQKVTDLLIDVVRAEVSDALADIARVGV